MKRCGVSSANGCASTPSSIFFGGWAGAEAGLGDLFVNEIAT